MEAGEEKQLLVLSCQLPVLSCESRSAGYETADERLDDRKPEVRNLPSIAFPDN